MTEYESLLGQWLLHDVRKLRGESADLVAVALPPTVEVFRRAIFSRCGGGTPRTVAVFDRADVPEGAEVLA